MIKSITFQGNRKFAANLYALEIKSRFIDQTHADGYYSGYGSELEAKVVGNQIQIGTGAFVVQGRISEVVSTEVVTPTIYGNCVGYVVARIETYHVSDDNNCTFKAYVNTALSEIPLRQDDVYATNADNENLVYELPIYSFEIKDRTIVNLQKLIKPIDDYARVQKEVDRIVKSTNDALALVQSATESSEQATMSADNAVKKSDSAVRLATEAKTTADGLADSIAQANTTAGEARQIAAEAEQASSNAVTTANEAKTTADGLADSIAQANTTAGEAKEIAEDAEQASSNAVTTANEAKTMADGLADSIAQANTTAGEAKEIAEEALEQSKVTGTKVNVDGAFQSNLNFDRDPQEQLNDLKSAETALQNGKVNKSGDTMSGDLTAPNFIGAFKQKDITKNYLDFVTGDGDNFGVSGLAGKIYRLNDLTNQYGQKMRGEKTVNIGASLQGEQSGFYSDAYEWYSKSIKSGGTGDSFILTWQFGGGSDKQYGLWLRVYNSGNLQYEQRLADGVSTPLAVNMSKLEPTTANGWTVGDKNLGMSGNGIYLVSVMADGGNSPIGIGILIYNGIANSCAVSQVGTTYSLSFLNSTWHLHSVMGGAVVIKQIAYKKIA
ncbi:MAG: hypothetical protein HFE31_00070 [Clostridia bacterium]|nr:hypothetical protein [Clostridia bacterium]